MPDTPETFRLGTAEITTVSLSSKRLASVFHKNPRGFLQERGVALGDAEPINVQQLCRDPNGTAPSHVLVVRKTCSLKGNPKVALVLVL
jgi:hypothetical protein